MGSAINLRQNYSVHCALNPWLISIVTLTDLIIGWCVCADLSKLLYKEGINDIRIRSWGCLTYDRDEAEKWGQSSSPTTLHFSGCVCWQNMSWVSLYSWFLGPKDGILSSQFTIPMRLNLGRNLGHRQEKTVYRRFRQIKSMAAVLSVSKVEEAFISHLKRKQRAESDRRPRRTLALTTVTSSYIFFTLRKICRNIDLQFSWLRHHLTWKKKGI